MEETVYSADPQLSFFGDFFRSLWADLHVSPPVAWRLFARNMQARYRQSWLGYLWLLLPPIATTLTWVYLNAANILNVGQTSVPYPIYVLTGTLLWQVFVDAMNNPLQQLAASRDMMTKARIPHEALLLSGLIEVVFNFCVRLLILIVTLAWFQFPLTWTWLLMPLGVLSLLLLGLAIGLLLTPIGLLYQDVSRALGMAMGFWFFFTPVIYPPPTQWPISLLASLNPVAPLLITTRNWLTLSTPALAPGMIPVVIFAFLLLLLAWIQYRIAKPHLIARL